MTIGVYRIINLSNGKSYYGSTNDLNRRCRDHFNNLKKDEHGNKHLQASVNKYGIDNFRFEIILETDCLELLLDFEQSYLDEFWDGGTKCYNICPIAGSTMTGRVFTQEHRANISKALTGKKASDETRANMSRSAKNNGNRPPNPLGRIHTKKTKDKMIKARIGKKHSQETKVNMSRSAKNRKNISTAFASEMS